MPPAVKQATRSYDYDSISKYVVIFRGPGQATIIELDNPRLSSIGTMGEGRSGRRWEISKGSYCY